MVFKFRFASEFPTFYFWCPVFPFWEWSATHALLSLCSWSATVAALSFCAAPSAMTRPRSRARCRCLSHALWFLFVQNLFIWSPYFSHSTFCKGFLCCGRGWVSPFGPKSTFSEDLTLLGWQTWWVCSARRICPCSPIRERNLEWFL